MRLLIVALNIVILVAQLSSHAQDLKLNVKITTIPNREPLNAKTADTKYKPPATMWKTDPVLWGWTCELPDGSGLAFGGVDQTANDGRPHTQLKTGKEWKSIFKKLRKQNKFQNYHHQIIILKNNCTGLLAKARHLYFEGKKADSETEIIKNEIQPIQDKLLKDLKKLIQLLKDIKTSDKYDKGQINFSLLHLDFALKYITPLNKQIEKNLFKKLRRARIELEIAAAAFDAEPPPRSLSLIAYDPMIKFYVIFGGDHMDYQTNDLWIYDSTKMRWFQKHPEASPEPRADHHFEALGDGRIAMVGGYYNKLGKGYVHRGTAKWIYDIKKNTWIADGHNKKLVSSNLRSSGYLNTCPTDRYLKGPRPNASENEKKLKKIPVNKWVRLKTPVILGSREFGTWAYDSDRDMLYVWSGGHVTYPGNDVARYHMATDRWEINGPISLPLGGIGTNEQYPLGVDFYSRPWMRSHTWNSYAYDTKMKKMVAVGHQVSKVSDDYWHVYDPDIAEWSSRHQLSKGVKFITKASQVRNTKHGLLNWHGNQAWLLDSKNMKWNKLSVEGKMPGTAVDSSGMVYDSKRDRMLLSNLGGYGKPYLGQIFALDLKTKKVMPLNPEGLNIARPWHCNLRETAYDPVSDLFINLQLLRIGPKPLKDWYPAYDANKNRWVAVKIELNEGSTGYPRGFVNTSIHYDKKRGLFWMGDASWNGGIWVLRFDHTKTEIKPLKDFKHSKANKK